MESMHMDRRSFLGSAAVLGGSLLFGGSFVGCSPQTEELSAKGDSWDKEADVVVVGAGGAGLACAVEGGAQGLSVIVLESQSMIGGSSAICDGGLQMPDTPLQREQGIEDSIDLMYEDLMNNTQVDNNPEVLRAHCEHAAELYDWLTDLGLEFKADGLLATAGQSLPREHHVNPQTLIDALQARAVEQGTEILTSTPATELVVDSESGEVLGVIAEAGSKKVRIRALKGVVLASGGFSRNVDMLNQHVFGTGAENLSVFTGAGDDGSGILMAQKIGAGTRHMGYTGLITGQNPNGSAADACAMMNVGAVCVNKEGLRFVDESFGYGGLWPYVMEQIDGRCFQVWDDAIAQQYQDNETSLYNMGKIEASGLLLKADTLAELAQLMGVPADAFEATMKAYNESVASTGTDGEFGRKTLISQSGTPLALETAPFYAYETGNVIRATTGGLSQTEKAQVMDVYGKVIPRLYCAGGNSVLSNQGIVPLSRRSVGASGTMFGGALIFGRIAAQTIAEEG